MTPPVIGENEAGENPVHVVVMRVAAPNSKSFGEEARSSPACEPTEGVVKVADIVLDGAIRKFRPDLQNTIRNRDSSAICCSSVSAMGLPPVVI
jgi:hypothetical protein